MSYQLIKASAHDTGLPDKSVHCIVKSPPYWGLRLYAGEQAIEWPTVNYSPMAGLPEITIQGCEPGCNHEWGEALLQREQSGRSRLKWETGGAPAVKVEAGPVSQGNYCQLCGGWRGGLGNEPTPETFIGHLILVMREMWRVLRDDGTCWVNLGDSYAGNRGNTSDKPGYDNKSAGSVGANLFYKGAGVPNGLKPKDLCMIPARFALAAQADGWFLRSDIIWAKRNPMPESVTDRPTKAHEFIYLLTKSEKYYYDCEAVREPLADESWGRMERKQRLMDRTGAGTLGKQIENGVNQDHAYAGLALGRNGKTGYNESGRNKRTVWSIASAPYAGAHFATYPIEIPLTCIKAGSSEHGVCPKCGAPWERVTEKTNGDTEAHERPKKTAGMTSKTSTLSLGGNGSKEWAERGAKVTTTGWRPSCACGAGEPIPATVLDPFNGSGTTGRAALQLNRSYIGVDICGEYLTDLAPERMSNVQIEMGLSI